MDTDVVAVTRHSPTTHETVVLVAYTAFDKPDGTANDLRKNIRPLRVEGVVEEIILEAGLCHQGIKLVYYDQFPSFIMKNITPSSMINHKIFENPLYNHS